MTLIMLFLIDEIIFEQVCHCCFIDDEGDHQNAWSEVIV